MDSAPPPSAAVVATTTSGDPHPAHFLVLHYLRLPELLAVERSCRAFREAVAGDPLLWRCLAVEPPLSSKITDEGLFKITSRAQGLLRSLALLDCWKITDAGLLRVVEHNPVIEKLSVPGCTSLSPEGMVRLVKHLSENKGNLNHLSVCGVVNLTEEHLGMFKSFLHVNNQQQCSKPLFYTKWRSLPLSIGDGSSIDVDICPKCRNVRLIFDCTRKKCRSVEPGWTECRGCYFCIARCEECGGCFDFEEHGEEMVCCSDLVCLDCWLQLPKCNKCNRPYCKRHSPSLERMSTSTGFICQQCIENEAYSATFS